MKSPSLEVQLGPLRLKNPILTASGTFGYGLEFAEGLDLAALGAVVVKGLSLRPRLGNAQPRIAETASGMLNSIGLQNVGAEVFLTEKLPSLVKLKATVLANLFGESEEEYVELAAMMAAADGVAGVELNLSCPNVKCGGINFGTDPQMVRRLTEAVRRVYPSRLLMVKLTPNVTDIAAIARAAKEGGADAVSAINTLRGMAVDTATGKPKLATVTGGLSGPAIKPVALAMVHQVVQQVGIPVVGIGGIMNLNDVLEFLIVGACAVQLGTANYLDAALAGRLPAELGAEIKRRGLPALSPLIRSLAI